jgi:mannose-6-phosphate isomerase-like protein (cupin superfamily)
MIYKEVESLISLNNLNVISKDIDRPWGGFYVLDESQAQSFASLFFNNLDVSKLSLSGKLSPKILVIKPKKRLSWQYHHRRSEIWSVIKGDILVSRSDDDVERELINLKAGEQIEIKKEERHRIIGTDKYALVAEIWIHTDKDNPSDEKDIVRVQDDFDRK